MTNDQNYVAGSQRGSDDAALVKASNADSPGLITDLADPRGDFLIQDDRQPISAMEARLLTERIRTATRHVCILLRMVHERRAWVPLGYASWEQYVQTEFSISRSRSYELLDQANVILDLRSTAGMTELPDVSAYVALQIKARLPQIKEALRERVRNARGRKVVDIVTELVDEHRQQVAQSRRLVQERRPPRQQDNLDSLDHFWAAIDVVVAMASAGQIDELVGSVEPSRIGSVESAIEWLGDLRAKLKLKQRLLLAHTETNTCRAS